MHVQTGRYQQMPIDELKRLVDEGSMDINGTNPIALERIQHAAQIVRDHLAEQHRRNLGFETDQRFLKLEKKLDDLKEPH